MITLSLLLAATLAPNAPTAASGAAPAPSPRLVASDGPPDSSFRYDYVDGAFVLGDFYGLRANGSYHLDGPWLALGRFEYLTEDEGNTDVDLLLFSGGVGYVHTLEDDLDFVGSAEIEIGHAEIDNPGGSADDDEVGLRLRAGLRFQANDEIELAGGVSFATIFDEDLGLDGQILYAFDEKLSGFVGFDIRDDTVALVGVRYHFYRKRDKHNAR